MKLNERREIDQIDQKMTQLFEQRMKLSAKIAQHKFEQNQPVTDWKREAVIISEETKQLQNQHLASYLKEFYQDLFLISKQYQAKIIQDLESSTKRSSKI